MSNRTQNPGTPLVAVFALVAAMALVLAGISMWFVASWGMGGMGNMTDHMQRMMGGGSNSAGEPTTAAALAEKVSIRDFLYAPGNLQVPVGATVTWTNEDSAPHTATDKAGMWNTAILKKGESRSIKFDMPGDYVYYCTVHPTMGARLQVR